MQQDKAGTVLIVDDDQDILLTAEIVLKNEVGRLFTESDPQALPRYLKESVIDVVLLDMNFMSGTTSGEEGMHWLQQVKSVSPSTQVILMTAYGGMELAIKAIKQGATDFVVKPWDNAKLIATVGAALKHSRALREVGALKSTRRYVNRYSAGTQHPIIGKSEALRTVLDTINKVAGTDANVLILGENGTGKELVARALHHQSARADQPFINIDIGAIPETLFESELFGHCKGAFTDARSDRPGRFEVASEGTLFLDEIGNLNPQMQAKLLGVLQSRTITRVGSDTPIPVDVRLISATNMPLDTMVDDFRFRQDLLYRINTVEIRLPPLRERQDDIPLLAEHFLNFYKRKYSKPEISMGPAALARIQKYSWPGNIRELQHCMERAVIMADQQVLGADDFGLLRSPEPSPASTPLNMGKVERDTIRKALVKHQGNLSKAAAELGMGRSTLYRKMEKYGL